MISNVSESFINLAAQSWHMGEYSHNREKVSKWTAAACAWQVYGDYEKGATLRLAERIKIYDPQTDTWNPASSDTVGSLAKAYDMFLYIHAWDKQKAWQARRTFGYTRFSTLAEAQRMYEFSPEQAYDFLFLKNSDDKYLGSRGMLAFVADALDERPEWQRRLTPLALLCYKYVTDFEAAPQWFRDELQTVMEHAKQLQEAK